MSKGDRRNFKLFAKLQEGDKQYIKLFDAIDRQEEYNEAELLEQFAGEKFTKQFSVAKNYLYNYILKTLHIFRKDAKTELNTILHQVQILISKNLFEQAQKHLRKAKHMAERQERFQELLYVLSNERYLLFRRHQVKEFDAFIEQIQEQELLTLRKVANLQEYDHLYDNLYRMVKRSSSMRDKQGRTKILEILNAPIIVDKEYPLTTRARLQRLTTIFLGNKALSNWSECKDALDELVAEYESNDDIRKEKSLNYISTVSNLGGVEYRLGNGHQVLKVINKLKVLPTESFEEELFIQEKYYQLKVALCQEIGEIEEGLATVAQFEAELPEFVGKLHQDSEFQIYFLIVNFLVFVGRPDEALQWVNRILNAPKTDVGTDIQSMARILNLIIHYSLGNLSYLEYGIKAAARFLANRDQLFQVERATIKYLKYLSDSDPGSSEQEILTGFENELKEIIKNPNEAKAMNLFDVLTWVKAQRAGVSMAHLQFGEKALEPRK